MSRYPSNLSFRDTSFILI